jgi:RNA polymerase sigma-70 factor, ECF subfamily
VWRLPCGELGLAANDENDWLEKARAGDVEAFGALVLAHQQFVYNLAWRALGDEQEAQDAAQEAFLRVWQALPNFRGQAQFRTWLYRIVTNVCYGRLPRLRRQFAALGEQEMGEMPDERHPEPSAEVEDLEQRAFLWRQIEALPESYRVLVLLRYQQGLPYEEIASVLSLPLGTVKTGLFRAHARLRAALSEFAEAPA